MDRRRFLFGATGVAAGCAGCSALSSEPVTLDLVVFNHTEYSHRVEVELFRTDTGAAQRGGSTASDARVYFERITVEPPEAVSDGPRKTKRNGVADSRPYVLRYTVWREYGTSEFPGVYDDGHVHFFPPGGAGDSDAVTFDIYDEGEMERR